MRDLKAKWDEINNVTHLEILCTKGEYLEAINRAIAAESVLNEIYPSIAGRVIQLQQAGEEKAAAEWNGIARKVYAAIEGKPVDSEVASLREENDQQRASIQNLSCQVAGLREGLKLADLFLDKISSERLPIAFFEGSTWQIIKQLLASPDPGEKYRRAVEAAKNYRDAEEVGSEGDGHRAMMALDDALDDLEGVSP